MLIGMDGLQSFSTSKVVCTLKLRSERAYCFTVHTVHAAFNLVHTKYVILDFVEFC